MLRSSVFAVNQPGRYHPKKEKPRHNRGPKEPGSDRDHEHDLVEEEERKRNWDEHHKREQSQ
jgi:hypothetical protein